MDTASETKTRRLPVTRGTLPPHPSGWYCVATLDELRAGDVLTRHFMDREIILFRTESGSLAATSAYCPHLGAHMGKGGEVCGETIRCPFHGFRFNTDGDCTETPYGTKVPARAKLQTYPVVERGGYVLAWFDPYGAAPTWTPPELDTNGWSPALTKRYELQGHPQETSENSVDIRHFEVVHGYTNVREIREATPEGPTLRARYAMRRQPMPGTSTPFDFDIDVFVHGLGYSVVEVDVPTFGMRSRQFVLSTPTVGEQIVLRVGMSVREIQKPEVIHPLLTLVPPALLNAILRRVAMRTFTNDVEQDFVIWKNKEFVARPALAMGDGPIGIYRRWAKQFYESLAENEASAA
jgi:nitrite reductase/ring-hydroxylating ferredoxin subunit